MASRNLEKTQIDLIREAICVVDLCNECVELHKGGQLCFLRMEEFVDDRGKSCLYRLKQMCHDLFRNAEEASYKEKFYDITVGYIFHEAMKIRENIYQLEYYKPQYKTLTDSSELTILEKKIIHEFDALIDRAEKRLIEGLKQVKILMKELVAQTGDLIKLYKSNYLLPRFVLENEKAFVKLFGKKGFDQLLNEMYDHGRRTLLFRAALSYLESEYYPQAKALFQRVLSLDKTNTEAQFFFLYASAFNSYSRNRFTRALYLAREALQTASGNAIMKKYSEALDDLIDEVSKEIKKTRKTPEGHDADL